MTVILILAGALLWLSATLAVWRIAKGPTGLDRIVASDVCVSIVIATIGIYTIGHRDDSGLSDVLVLSLLGFSGAVSVARLLGSAATVRRTFDRRRAAREVPRDN